MPNPYRNPAYINKIRQEYNEKLLIAARNGDIESVKILLTKFVDLNSSETLQELLLNASIRGHTNIIDLLIDNHINVNATGMNGNTPLLLAIQNKHTGVVKLLLKRRANPNQANNSMVTPLTLAVSKNYQEILPELIKTADINRANQRGQTPLLIAAENNYTDCAKLLLEKRAKVNWYDVCGRSPLSFAAENGNTDLVKRLLEKGATVSTTDNRGHTPLWYANQNKHNEMVQLLTENGATLNPVEDHSLSPVSANTTAELEAASQADYATTHIEKNDSHPDISKLGITITPLPDNKVQSFKQIYEYITKNRQTLTMPSKNDSIIPDAANETAQDHIKTENQAKKPAIVSLKFSDEMIKNITRRDIELQLTEFKHGIAELNEEHKNIAEKLTTLHDELLQQQYTLNSSPQNEMHSFVITSFTSFTKMIEEVNNPLLLTQLITDRLDKKIQEKKSTAPLSPPIKSAICGIIGAVIGFAIGATIGAAATIWAGGFGAIPAAWAGAGVGAACIGTGLTSSFSFFRAKNKQQIYQDELQIVETAKNRVKDLKF